jgi:hypothetical protein
MSKSRLSISRQLIRPSKLQAWVFVVGCGLSSMTGAFATALFMAPSTFCDRPHAHAGYSEQFPEQPCRSLDIHSRMDRATARWWFTSAEAREENTATLVPTPLGSGLVGLTISDIENGSVYQSIGLLDGDIVASIEGIHFFSANSDRLLRDKVLSDSTDSMSMALLRDGCPATLEVVLQ